MLPGRLGLIIKVVRQGRSVIYELVGLEVLLHREMSL